LSASIAHVLLCTCPPGVHCRIRCGNRRQEGTSSRPAAAVDPTGGNPPEAKACVTARLDAFVRDLAGLVAAT
jgi:hypothetical protein